MLPQLRESLDRWNVPARVAWDLGVCGDPDLTNADVRVGIALRTFGDANGTSLYPSVAAIAARAGVSVSSVHRGLRRLELAGWVRITPSKGGRRATNTYELIIPTDWRSPVEKPCHP